MAVTMVVGNAPKISASLLSPGYSIAAVIANEFAEANGDLYISSLIFMALVLVRLDDCHQRDCQNLYHDDAKEGWLAMMMEISPSRRIINGFMLTLSGLCTVLVVSVLFFILGYLLISWRYLSELGLFYQAAQALGRNRRRHGQCHRRQRQSAAPGDLDWRPHRLFGGSLSSRI
jgi:hypothetical protein